MKALRPLFMVIILFVNTSLFAQNNFEPGFDKKMKMAMLIMEQQPGKEAIKDILTEGFALDSITNSGYYMSYMEQNTKSLLTVFLNQTTTKVEAAEFYVKGNLAEKNDISNYLETELKFVYSESKRNVDYYIKDKISVRLSIIGPNILVHFGVIY